MGLAKTPPHPGECSVDVGRDHLLANMGLRPLASITASHSARVPPPG